MVVPPLRWSLLPDLHFMQQDIPTDVIIIVTPRDIFIGEVMITGTTWTEHT